MKRLRYAVPLAAALALAACQQQNANAVTLSAAPPEATAAPVVEVTPYVVEARPIQDVIKATGSAQPLRSASLGAPVTATIKEILVQENAQVAADDLLVRLDDSQARLRASQAQSAATAASVQASQAQADYQRLAPLAQRGSIAASRADQLKAQARAAKASAQAAQAAARAAKRAVTDAEVRAPFAGTILKVPVEVGELATMAPATTLIRLADLSELEVRVRVHERDLLRLSTGDVITARFPNLGLSRDGTLSQVGLEIDPATRTAEVIARIPNPGRQIPIGAFTEIAATPTGGREALVLPRSAVQGEGDGAQVFVITGDQVEKRAVRVRPVDEQRVEVVDGLSAGQRVVREGLQTIVDGARVTVGAVR